SFPERAPLQSRLVKQGGVVSERLYRLPAAAEALDRALPWSAPPQRPVFEALSAFFRSGDSAPFEAAQHAWAEARGPVDAFAGFIDTSADPRGRKALFSAVVGMADPERTAVLDRLRLRNTGEAVLLLAAAGADRAPAYAGPGVPRIVARVRRRRLARVDSGRGGRRPQRGRRPTRDPAGDLVVHGKRGAGGTAPRRAQVPERSRRRALPRG